MKFNIVKFSQNKAKKAVINSSKIEGYKVPQDKSIKIKMHKIASRLCPIGNVFNANRDNEGKGLDIDDVIGSL